MSVFCSDPSKIDRTMQLRTLVEIVLVLFLLIDAVDCQGGGGGAGGGAGGGRTSRLTERTHSRIEHTDV